MTNVHICMATDARHGRLNLYLPWLKRHLEYVVLLTCVHPHRVFTLPQNTASALRAPTPKLSHRELWYLRLGSAIHYTAGCRTAVTVEVPCNGRDGRQDGDCLDQAEHCRNRG
jgi:hypothetical protein